MNFLKLIPTLFTLLTLAACASVPMANRDDDTASKKFEIPADKSRIYVYRNESLGAGVKISLALDGKMMGQTAKNVYYAWDVTPGNHQVSCFAEANSMVDVNAKPGKAVYVWQEMKMGLVSAGCAMHEVDEGTGRNAVLNCERAQSLAP